MLEHLIDFEPEVEDKSSGFVPLEKTDAASAVDAKISTADWLKELGAVDDDVLTELDAKASRETFSSLITAQPPRTHPRGTDASQDTRSGTTSGGHADRIRLGVC